MFTLDEKFVGTVAKLAIAAIGGACATNLVIEGFRNKKNNKKEVVFTPDMELEDETDDKDIEVVDAEVVENATAAKGGKKKAPKTVTLDVDENGNIINPIKFNAANMIIQPE
jgi:hypothetical protein